MNKEVLLLFVKDFFLIIFNYKLMFKTLKRLKSCEQKGIVYAKQKFISILCIFILIFQAVLIINPIKTEAAVDIPNSFSGRGSLTQTSAQGGNFSGYASITSGLPASAKGTSGSFSINCLDPTAGDIKEVGVSTTGGSYTATK